MELTNEFRVGVPVDQAWEVLTDLERVAPCMPGAELQEVEGDEHRGVVKVKVGPITTQYRGKARFVELDRPGGQAVLLAEGRETRGQGSAKATIHARLRPEGDATSVSLQTDLSITGRVAQFGRGVLSEVSAKLLEEFVSNLETTVLGGGATAAPATDARGGTGGGTEGGASGGATGPQRATAPAGTGAKPGSGGAESSATDGAATEPGAGVADASGNGAGVGERPASGAASGSIDILAVAGRPLAKRIVPILVVGGLVVVTLAGWRRRRR